ncbi:hypothetical protein ETI06_05745 [Macrococcoides goetzii]|nr:hypothetical protein [Macrococcus goetzii]TDM49976.1 hypothetical protein ETI06_05745 [Macrococcus goetzii]
MTHKAVVTPHHKEPQVKRVTLNEVMFLRGKGTEDEPFRHVYQYVDDNGNILAEFDPCVYEITSSVEVQG